MKKIFISVLFCLIAILGFSQNIQLHYDMGSALYDRLESNRPQVTTTVEMFKSDKWGSTYFFIDMDYRSEGIHSAYWEISREFNIGKKGLAAHVECDGGLNTLMPYNNCYLGGLAYNWNSTDFLKGFSVQVMYKYMQKTSQPHSWQLTGVWRDDFANGICSFSGFFDVWHDNNVNGNLIFVSEPQFWVNLYRIKGIDPDFKLSFGTEVELSNNFIWGNDGRNNRFYGVPTLAAKWTF